MQRHWQISKKYKADQAALFFDEVYHHRVQQLIKAASSASFNIIHINICLCSDVQEISEQDKEDQDAFDFDEAQEMASLGALGPVGEKGFTTLERR